MGMNELDSFFAAQELQLTDTLPVEAGMPV
jgi:hypothetical protein